MPDNASDNATEPQRPDADPGQRPNPETEPANSASGQRSGQRSVKGRPGPRDMLLSMLVLAIGVLVITAITRSCSFSPGGPSTNSSNLPTVDVSAELQAGAGQVHFPLRQSQLPADWRANSASVDSLGTNGADQAVRIGWVTGGGRFLQLSQSNASAADLAAFVGGLGAGAQPTGTVTVNGTKWTIYPAVRSESSWVTDLGPVRLLITGNGNDTEFRQLATAIVAGRIVGSVG